MNQILSDIAARYNLRRKGPSGSGKWVGPCPKCSGKARSDKFNIRDDGGFKCYACDFKGDIITWLKKMENMSCPEAHEAAHRECRFSSCPVRETCRLGDSNSKQPKGRPVRTARPRPKAADNTLSEVSPQSPKKLWLNWATSLLEKSKAKLQENKSLLSWLNARGINRADTIRFKLGFLDHDRRVDRKSIGLPPMKNGKSKLWVPGGLVIPIFDESDQLHRIRIRRTDESRAKFLPNLKYVWIEGSGTEPLAIAPAFQNRGSVIVEAELDAMAVAAAHSDVLVVAVGSVQGGVQESLAKKLHASPVILVALDAEPGKDGEPGPGPKAVRRWKASYRQAKFWPVIKGKDPGDYMIEGGDLTKWIEYGLVPELKLSKVQDLALSTGSSHRGERGEVNSHKQQSLEMVEGLRWCSICHGDEFLAAEGGGYFCTECVPLSKPGRLVRAVKQYANVGS